LLEQHFGQTVVASMAKGRTSSFEVTAQIVTDGQETTPTLIYSKFAKGCFPDGKQVIADIEAWASSGKAPQ